MTAPDLPLPPSDGATPEVTREPLPEDKKEEEAPQEDDEVMQAPDLNHICPSGNPLFVVMKAPVEEVEKLTKMGYSLVASEKALFHSNPQTADKALTWLEMNELSSKLDEPIKPRLKSDLTEEEREKRAVALQKTLRAQITDREKIEAREKDEERRKRTKGQHETASLIEDAERQRELARIQREKEIDASEKKRLHDEVIVDYRERFGEYPPEGYFDDVGKEGRDAEKKAAIALVMQLQNKLVKINPQGLKACFTMLLTYFRNVESNPLEPKYKKIKCGNKHFEEKVAPYPEALLIMENVGFQKNGEGFYEMGDLPNHTIGDAIKYMNLLAQKL